MKLTEFLIEALYRFEGSETMLHRALNERSAAGRISREGEARLAARTPLYRSRVAATARRAGAAEHAP